MSQRAPVVVLDDWVTAPCDSVVIQARPGEAIIRVRVDLTEVRERIAALTTRIADAHDAQLAFLAAYQGLLEPATPAPRPGGAVP